MLALRLFFEGKATSRVLSLFLLPGLCHVSLALYLFLFIQNLGKCFLPLRGSWSVWRRRILSIAVASTCLASTKAHVEISCWEVLGAGRVLRIYILLRRLE